MTDDATKAMIRKGPSEFKGTAQGSRITGVLNVYHMLQGEQPQALSAQFSEALGDESDEEVYTRRIKVSGSAWVPLDLGHNAENHGTIVITSGVGNRPTNPTKEEALADAHAMVEVRQVGWDKGLLLRPRRFLVMELVSSPGLEIRSLSPDTALKIPLSVWVAPA